MLAELLLGQPVFPGATAGDQLVEIIKILGTPTSDDFSEINRNFQNFSFPSLRPTSWHKVHIYEVLMNNKNKSFSSL